MNLLIYIFIYPLIWVISILPFRVLHLISDFAYVILYYIIDYRKKIVLSNLQQTFPEKSHKELIKIQKKFYKHFVDIFIEIIKTFTISKKEITKRYKYTNINLLNDLYKDGKSVILVGSHYANWEWILNLNPSVNYQCVGAYKKVRNKYLNTKILNSRSKFGVHLVPTNKTIPLIIKNHKNNIQAIYGLLSDQSPQLKKSFYWKEFLGVKVPIHTGAEMLAKKYDMNVVYFETTRIKRGFYETTFSLITNDAKKYPDYKLTDIYLDKVEKQIRKQPEYYFWTHNRFKHKDKAPKETV